MSIVSPVKGGWLHLVAALAAQHRIRVERDNREDIRFVLAGCKASARRNDCSDRTWPLIVHDVSFYGLGCETTPGIGKNDQIEIQFPDADWHWPVHVVWARADKDRVHFGAKLID